MEEHELVCYPRSSTYSLRSSVCCVLVSFFPLTSKSRSRWRRLTLLLRCILQFYYRTYQLHAYTDSLTKQVILLDALKKTILLNASLLALLSEFYFLLYKQRNPPLMLLNVARSTIANDSTSNIESATTVIMWLVSRCLNLL